MKYRKKPVTIDAFQLGYEVAPVWFTDRIANRTVILHENDYETLNADIETLEGWHHASTGDYIIRGVKGEIYPCKPDIFEMTYEVAE